MVLKSLLLEPLHLYDSPVARALAAIPLPSVRIPSPNIDPLGFIQRNAPKPANTHLFDVSKQPELPLKIPGRIGLPGILGAGAAVAGVLGTAYELYQGREQRIENEKAARELWRLTQIGVDRIGRSAEQVVVELAEMAELMRRAAHLQFEIQKLKLLSGTEGQIQALTDELEGLQIQMHTAAKAYPVIGGALTMVASAGGGSENVKNLSIKDRKQNSSDTDVLASALRFLGFVSGWSLMAFTSDTLIYILCRDKNPIEEAHRGLISRLRVATGEISFSGFGQMTIHVNDPETVSSHHTHSMPPQGAKVVSLDSRRKAQGVTPNSIVVRQLNQPSTALVPIQHAHDMAWQLTPEEQTLLDEARRVLEKYKVARGSVLRSWQMAGLDRKLTQLTRKIIAMASRAYSQHLSLLPVTTSELIMLSQKMEAMMSLKSSKAILNLLSTIEGLHMHPAMMFVKDVILVGTIPVPFMVEAVLYGQPIPRAVVAVSEELQKILFRRGVFSYLQVTAHIVYMMLLAKYYGSFRNIGGDGLIGRIQFSDPPMFGSQP